MKREELEKQLAAMGEEWELAQCVDCGEWDYAEIMPTCEECGAWCCCRERGTGLCDTCRDHTDDFADMWCDV